MKTNKKILAMIQEGNLKKLQKHIDEGFDVNYLLNYYPPLPLLYHYVLQKDIPIIKFLLDNGANPNFLPSGNNAFYYTGFNNEKDVEIVKILAENKTWFLPFWNSKMTIIESLEYNEAGIEQQLQNINYHNFIWQQSSYNSNSNYNSNRYYGGGKSEADLQEEYETIRKQIDYLRPLKEKYVKKLQIHFLGSDRVEPLEIDERADIQTLKNLIRNFFLPKLYDDDFDLLMPSFHLKNKKIMELDRALSDYGVKNETKISVVLKVASSRHWNADGGKRGHTRKNPR